MLFFSFFFLFNDLLPVSSTALPNGTGRRVTSFRPAAAGAYFSAVAAFVFVNRHR